MWYVSIINALDGFKCFFHQVAVPDVVDAAKDADILIFVVPHQFIRTLCSTLLGKIKPTAIGLSLIKVSHFLDDITLQSFIDFDLHNFNYYITYYRDLFLYFCTQELLLAVYSLQFLKTYLILMLSIFVLFFYDQMPMSVTYRFCWIKNNKCQGLSLINKCRKLLSYHFECCY